MINKIIRFFELVGTARAASHLARIGHPDLAKKLMLMQSGEKFEVHP